MNSLSQTTQLCFSQTARRIPLGWATAQQNSEMSSSGALFPIKMGLVQPQIKFLGLTWKCQCQPKEEKEKGFFKIFFQAVNGRKTRRISNNNQQQQFEQFIQEPPVFFQNELSLFSFLILDCSQIQISEGKICFLLQRSIFLIYTCFMLEG